MSHTAKRWSRKATALLAAMAVSLFGALALAQPASAVNINDARDGNSSITIHKHAQGAVVGTPATGLELGTAPADPLEDVEFLLFQLTGIDLGDESGWETVQDIQDAIAGGATVTPDTVPNPATVTIGGEGPFAVTAVGSEDTDANGLAPFTGLDFGIYLVIEGADSGDNNIVNPAPPFLVTVPTAAPSGSTWIYDVHVYPKNSVTSATKTSDLGSAGALYQAGDVVSWTITADVPYLAPGDDFTEFRIQDVLPSGLTFLPASSSVVVSAGTFASPADYTVVESPVGEVNLTFTGTGLQELQDEAQGGTVTWTFQTRVGSIPVNGTINNTATVHINDTDTTASGNAGFGQLTIFKHAADGNAPLEGAVFHLYRTNTGGTLSDRVQINGADWVGTSNGSGAITIPALKPGTYYLEEVTAPAGYQPLAAPIQVTIVAGQTVGTSVNYEAVANTQVDGWDLPLTGGSGTTLLILVGSGLVLIAGGAAMVNHRRKNRQVAH
ncbi:LPXTG-motif cell wall anchor domain-containing protein/fimbrial isopeptide formation D2 domain-containing protein [Micrococcales bacterium KH10]|nr:LPXTG-motif cell wall anchor domain-containing protein/fimbrial isopeptide formation D2 domain-containing protein [Micrococcales bacterium KH10]